MMFTFSKIIILKSGLAKYWLECLVGRVRENPHNYSLSNRESWRGHG